MLLLLLPAVCFLLPLPADAFQGSAVGSAASLTQPVDGWLLRGWGALLTAAAATVSLSSPLFLGLALSSPLLLPLLSPLLLQLPLVQQLSSPRLQSSAASLVIRDACCLPAVLMALSLADVRALLLVPLVTDSSVPEAGSCRLLPRSCSADLTAPGPWCSLSARSDVSGAQF